MKKLFFVIAAVTGMMSQPAGLAAQDDTARTPGSGGFENSGAITLGYRFTEVKGYRAKFEELFDLKSGPRLLDFSLFGKAREGSHRWADDYSFTGSGIGGDPFSSFQGTLRKKAVYELRANFHQSRYYWNRNDAATLPNGLPGLTGNHNWATVRKTGSVDLLVHVTNNLRFTLEYRRNTRDGLSETTRSPVYFGSSAVWGAFARANTYLVTAPFAEESNRGTAGIEYTGNGWALHYRAGYQRYSDATNGVNSASPERSINVGEPTTATELLKNLTYSDSRQLSTPVSEFSYTGNLFKGLEARGGYMFYRYQGPASLDMAFSGSARTNTAGTVDAPYAVSLTTRSNLKEPNHVLMQGFTYKLREKLSLLADYRYSRFRIDGDAKFRSVDGPVPIVGISTSAWRSGTSTLDLKTIFTPAASLLVSVGVRLLKEDITQTEDGVINPVRTRRIKTAWPLASVYYQPLKMLTVRGDVESINIGTSYTAITPHTDVGGRYSVRFRPVDKFYLEDSGAIRNGKLLQTDYRSRVRSNAVTANYELNERFTAFAGFHYDSLFASGRVNFLRGPLPFTNLALRDQTVDRVWQLGLRAEPMPHLGFTFTGNYVRTTGGATIQGEAPRYGPVRFPCATGSLYYDVASLGRMSVNLQRTYYSEQIVPGNNFSANILTLAWTKNY